MKSSKQIRIGIVGIWTVEQDFINAVLNPTKPRPKPDFLEGIKYMRVVQAAAEAMESGKAERVC